SANLKTSKLASLNSLTTGAAQTELHKCCGSKRWAEQMSAERPFESLDDLLSKADLVWWSLEPGDWLEAFLSHPKIGEKKAAAATSEQSKQWSAAEQAGIADAANTTLATLAELNQKYQDKFGYIFIVCASGKSSEEILAILQRRLENDRDEELRIAAAEQAKITKLRLQKLVEG
ncbi:MAG TPA: 2-oxo-4-hydroxy-4-carboxy-5-ureidoimidazoline decarboxylase, partial [Pyrinomonadaceae bacterium]|nr:2-oxo-4-hydroxy-4-carboxy-5-ureidoimidazoline decarboxylase [Pyrinomonadaceae bacterium]